MAKPGGTFAICFPAVREMPARRVIAKANAAYARLGLEHAGVGGGGAAGESSACFVVARYLEIRSNFDPRKGTALTSRTATKTVTFRRPFILSGFERIQAAGTYTVDTEEERIESLSFPLWKRISTVMRLSGSGEIEHRPIDPDELREALMRDGAGVGPNGALDGI